MEDLKNKIEALLFSTGKAMSYDEIKKIVRARDDGELRKALQDLEIDYNNRDSALMLTAFDNTWKIHTRDPYHPVVKKVVAETELSKSLMETLAVIAWKYPIKQSDLIATRTNKAYDHLAELEQLGYISRQKFGRTKIIKLTDRFFSYFDLPPEKVKERFADFGQIAQTIKEKEQQIKDMKLEHHQQVEAAKRSQEEHEQQEKAKLEQEEKEIDLLDKQGKPVKLEQYESGPEPENPANPGLEVYDSKEGLEEEKQERSDGGEENSDSEDKDGPFQEDPGEKEEESDSETDAEPKEGWGYGNDSSDSEGATENPSEDGLGGSNEPVEEKDSDETIKPKEDVEDPIDKRADEIVERILHPKEGEDPEPEDESTA